MKKFLAAIGLTCLSATSFAEQITLVCRGWHPLYQSFDEKPLNPFSQDEAFVIKLDTQKKVALYDTPAGEISTDFKERQDSYDGRKVVAWKMGNHQISRFDLNINRLDGSTLISYVLNNNDKDRRVLFTGTCAPGKQLF